MPDAMTEQDAGAAPLPIADFVERAGAIDLAWGHPDPALLPVDELRAAFDRALDGYANARREEDEARKANYARIIAADEAAIARERAERS